MIGFLDHVGRTIRGPGQTRACSLYPAMIARQDLSHPTIPAAFASRPRSCGLYLRGSRSIETLILNLAS
jgi:hypothetical protein